ncbi:hypothetical protein JX265_012937 [Neoarthrinium moseri]|uniref:NAD-dependent epimerase/dehydratase domain-containing protein n=1 Tax=Neoarthrinium moseri TaxID=1658444 RepID=A0A9Q0AI73_9PEZI|nr:hypothetical protein JX266_013052 [Neoarthrinium moseri]KAI1852909.1 hypothetical protein JX265_012937 [Neoarthrinium moseri]
MAAPSVLILGATGFIGAPLSRLLKNEHPDWSVTAYVRSVKGATEDALKATLGGVDHLEVGDFSEFDKIKHLSAQHDIVINSGNSATAEPVAAIIAGLRERKAHGSKGKLIHISGAGNFIDFGTSGNFNPSSKVWNDDNEDDIKHINNDMFNGRSDVAVLEAGATGDIDTYIACPSVVYGGSSTGSSGVGVGYSLITGNAKSLGYVPYAGDGTAILSTTHVSDLVDFLVTITNRAAAPQEAEGTAYSRYYLLETGRVQWKALATEFARVLHREDPTAFPASTPRNVTHEEAGEGALRYLITSNMLLEGPRARRAGFEPKGKSILEQMSDDLKGMFI